MSTTSLQGRTAVITGASRGLGAGLAEAFHAHGLKLGLCARGDSPLAGRDGVVARKVDVTDEQQVAQFAEEVVGELGGIDLWINNAGVLEPISFVRDLDSAALMQHLSINVAGVVHGSKAYVRHLSSSERSGVLVNISSGAALKGYAGWAAYAGGKAAVDRITECIQHEEGQRVRAYSVAPGVIDTNMQQTIRALTPEQFPLVEKFRQLKADDAFNTPAFVAAKLLDLAFVTQPPPTDVVMRLPNEQR